MKNYIINILCLLFVLVMTGCVEEIEPEHVESSEFSDYIQFSIGLEATTKSTGNDTYKQVYSNFEVEVQDRNKEVSTKVNPVNTLEGKAGVTGYIYNGSLGDQSQPWDKMTNAAYTFDGNTLKGDNLKWKDVQGANLRVFACAPYMSSEQLQFNGAIPSLSYTVPDKVEDQKDIVSAYSDVIVSESFGQSIPLVFGHAMTGVQIKSDFPCTVQSVILSNIYYSGSYSLDGNWTVDTQSTQTFKIEFSEGKIVGAGESIIDGDKTWMMIPQTLSDDAKLTVVCSDNVSYEYSLKGLKWTKGKIVTYTLYDSTKESSYIYFDLDAGNVNIGPGENKVTGYVYEKGNPEPVLKAYTHSDDKTYYVYQSTKAKRDAGSGVVDGGKVILPEYPAIVTPSGQSWADFITNNTSVENVIETWDDGKNVRGEDAPDENLIGTAVVRTAGRTHTRNYIKVTGQGAKYNLTIDNIYSVIQQPVNSGQAFRLRSVGGIAYIPAGNTELTVNFVGDNRMGCLHIDNTPTDKIYLQGTGTLTVADADFLTVKDVGDYSSDFGDNKGYISNFWNSAIGNNTDDNTGEKVYNLYINSGVVFAGATKTEDCSAIGGGGNGFGQVYITGGTVTAVSTTAGTAIGGGMGHTAKGGSGEVHISGGNIYAYNFPNRWSIPSSAIGGGSSYSNVGQNGTVTISGGYVYAYSGIGTAIGGGSSSSKVGGDADIVISGGDITAISGGGSGIGGGSACTGGSKTEIHNGGNAVVTISGNPVIRTGSIGGGITNGAAGSKIGSAKINISGGDIQAQFVMAAGAKETPAFTMSGGVIRDSDVKDPEYKHIQQNGGAVYMEDGEFAMTGGTIRDCSAEYGGAVYIKKGTASATPPSFKMSGGTISNCIATDDGGAVYLEDGSVEISNTAAVRACSASGSGGAVCVKKVGTSVPSFKMSAGTISKNFAGSQGGAIHLEGGSVEVSGGSISGNVVSEGNGGGISVNSGSFLMPLNGTAVINANSTLSKISTGGNGGGVYVTSESDDVKVDILSGSITGNSSAQKGGGIAVDLPSSEVKAEVTVGSLEDSETDPRITDNVTLLQGGGLYVNGENATVTINSGRIADNSTVGYVDNPDVMNEGGMVRLNGGEVNSVYVIFHANADGAYLNGDTNQSEARQRIVTDTKNRIEYPTTFRNGYNFKEWNTRADGLGTPFNAELVKRSSDLVLYAIWTVN